MPFICVALKICDRVPCHPQQGHWVCFYFFYSILEGQCCHPCRRWSERLTLPSWPLGLSRDLALRSGVLVTKKGSVDEQEEVVAFVLECHDFSGAILQLLPWPNPCQGVLGPHSSKSFYHSLQESMKVPHRSQQWLHPPFPFITGIS